MASSVATQHIRSRMKIGMFDHDPGSTSAGKVTSADGGTTEQWWDMRDLVKFAVAAACSVSTSSSGITKLEIVAAPTPASTDTDIQVIKDSGTIAATATGKWAIEECSAEEIAQIAEAEGVALRYVAARITVSNSGDEAVVVYIGEPVNPAKDLTPATTVA
jgi:hypothetical protein